MDNLENGIAAIQAGNRKVAIHYLRQALVEDPANANAWLWMAEVVENQDQKQECLRNVLSLQPGNQEAQNKLAELELGPLLDQFRAMPPFSAEEQVLQKPQSEDLSSPPGIPDFLVEMASASEPEPAQGSTPMEEGEKSVAPGATTQAFSQVSPEAEKPPVSPVAPMKPVPMKLPAASKPASAAPEAKKKKMSKLQVAVLVILALIVFLILVCVVGGAIIYAQMPGLINSILPSLP